MITSHCEAAQVRGHGVLDGGAGEVCFSISSQNVRETSTKRARNVRAGAHTTAYSINRLLASLQPVEAVDTPVDAPANDSVDASDAPADAVEEVEAQEDEQPVEIVVETAPIDPRFPATNQARHCFVKYNEAHKCNAENGEDDETCQRLSKAYRSICPVEWLEKWNEARDANEWWGKY